MVSRTQEFTLGGSTDKSVTVGTPQTVSSGYVPHSVDDAHGESANGMAQGNTGADRRIVGSTKEGPTPNGSAAGTFKQELSTNTYRNV